jgi:hypothetical protein
MTDQNEGTSEDRRAKARYRGAIVLIILFGAAAWFIAGYAAVSGIGQHLGWDLGGLLVWAWISPCTVSMVIAIAAILAIFVPKLAIKRGYTRPRRLATIVVSLWFLVSLINALVGFVALV